MSLMELIFCDCWRLNQEGKSVECRWRTHHNYCKFRDSDIDEMKHEGVFCPFWDLPRGEWIDSQELGYLITGMKEHERP